MLQPLSDPLQAGIRLLPHPIPAAPSAHLAMSVPLRGDYGLTTFRRQNKGGLGRASSPVARHLRGVSSEHPVLATYLLVQACQHLWLVLHDGVYQHFTGVDHTTRSWSPTTLMLAVAVSAHAPTTTRAGEDTLSGELRTPSLPRTHVPVGYRRQNGG